MIRKHPIFVGCVAGALVWVAVAWFLFASSHYDSVFYRVAQALSWIPDRTSVWITAAVIGGPVEAGALVFLPMSFAYWLCVGAAAGAGAHLMMRKRKEAE
jgi:hypothetical protein